MAYSGLVVYLALVLYLMAFLCELVRCLYDWRVSQVAVVVLGGIAALVHAWLLHAWIDIGVGQNLSTVNCVSMVIWLCVIAALFPCKKLWLKSLRLLLFPLAMVSIWLAKGVADSRLVVASAHGLSLFHVISGLLILAVGLVALLQAVVSQLQRWQLRSGRLFGWLQYLPPLQVTERLLSYSVQGVCVLLTVDVILSFWWFSGGAGHSVIKMVMVFVAWLIFTVLAWCLRYGKIGHATASYWVMPAVLALLLI
jgi:ABC-type uncharacterized transport system permease subunit